MYTILALTCEERRLLEATVEKEYKPSLLGDDYLTGYHRGEAALLVTNRNAALGQLLAAERAVPYIHILFRLLIFRREHELEPLYEDIFNAVVPAQEAGDAEPYTFERFRDDINQLQAWKLVECRIEKQRLRGYRDQRKAKFRYRLTDECAAFLQWLEERLEEDYEATGDDTRDLLEELCGSLRELLRLLHRAESVNADVDDARRILYQLHKVADVTYQVNDGLGTFNARMLSFLLGAYELAEVRQILDELDHYVEKFLMQVEKLRRDALPNIERLLTDRMREKLGNCLAAMESERKSSPHLYRGRGALNLGHVPEQLDAFYREHGTLDRLCRRINQTAIDVWRKLHAHLRELERKSTRLDDLRARLREMATLPEMEVPSRFLRELLAPAQMRGDPHYWDEFSKADPDQPRRHAPRQAQPPVYLASKPAGDKPVRSLDEARLEQLKAWLEAKILAGQSPPAKLSHGRFESLADLVQVIELSKAGLLNRGRRLQRIDFVLRSLDEPAIIALEDERQLDFRELELQRHLHG